MTKPKPDMVFCTAVVSTVCSLLQLAMTLYVSYCLVQATDRMVEYRTRAEIAESKIAEEE